MNSRWHTFKNIKFRKQQSHALMMSLCGIIISRVVIMILNRYALFCTSMGSKWTSYAKLCLNENNASVCLEMANFYNNIKYIPYMKTIFYFFIVALLVSSVVIIMESYRQRRIVDINKKQDIIHSVDVKPLKKRDIK